ncbi:MAG: hypothetical protein P4L67_04870 [Candidatus Pacebacteria bacterium]|nr:hypothetical protein [Candidatus Paceibacterota bacterium]
MSTNIELNAGAGGAKLVTYKTAAGEAYAPAAMVFMTSVTDNAAVAQPVQVGNGMPVVQDGTWVVNPGDTPNTNPWVMSIKQGGNTAVVNSSGQLTVLAAISGTVSVGAISSITSITNPVTVVQPTASSLLCTANIASGQTLGTVTTVGTVSTVTAVTGITNPVTVAQPTAANLNATVSIASAQTLATVTNVGTVGTITNAVTVSQPTASNLNATVSIAAAQTLATVTNVGTVGAVTSVTNPVTVAQPTASNLNATVSLAAAQTLATVSTVTAVTGITNPVTVAQSNAANLLATVSIASAQTLATVTTVGTVTNVTTVGTITNPVGVAAGTNLIGKIANADDVSTLYSGAVPTAPLYATFTASSSGNTQVVASSAGKQIVVLQWSATANGTVNVKWQSATTDISGLRYMIQYASAGGSYSPIGRFRTASSAALNINLSGAVSVSGEVAYVLV